MGDSGETAGLGEHYFLHHQLLLHACQIVPQYSGPAIAWCRPVAHTARAMAKQVLGMISDFGD